MYDNTANSQINNSAGHMIKFVGKEAKVSFVWPYLTPDYLHFFPKKTVQGQIFLPNPYINNGFFFLSSLTV